MKVHTACVFIYPKDVQQITRKSIRHASLLISKIRAKLGKQKGQGITVAEFCKYMLLDEEEVVLLLRL